VQTIRFSVSPRQSNLHFWQNIVENISFDETVSLGRTWKGFAFLYNEERICQVKSENPIIRTEMRLSNQMSEVTLVIQTLKKLIILRLSLYVIPFVSCSTQIIPTKY
jgi:hypothetical protein